MVILLAVTTACGESESPSVADQTIAGVERYDAVDPATDKSHVAAPVFPASPKPPVRGAHSQGWHPCRIYDAPVPDGAAVHSLEHGAVWITYQPGLAAEQLSRLAALTRLKPKYVLVSPYPGQPGRIQASAWGLQLKAEEASDPRLEAFVRRYAGGDQGGEGGAAC